MGYDFYLLGKDVYLSYNFSKFREYWCPKHSIDEQFPLDILKNLQDGLNKLEKDGFTPHIPDGDDGWSANGNVYAYHLKRFYEIVKEELENNPSHNNTIGYGPIDCSCKGDCGLKKEFDEKHLRKLEKRKREQKKEEEEEMERMAREYEEFYLSHNEEYKNENEESSYDEEEKFEEIYEEEEEEKFEMIPPLEMESDNDEMELMNISYFI